jgi:prepilin-type N-terminal cleavage/methylation domain-containing protein
MKKCRFISLRGRPPGSARAFSLIELLIVLAIFSILAVLTMPSVVGVTASGKITEAGNLVAGVTNAARENSIAHGALTALVMVNNSGNPNWDGRLFIALQMETSSAGQSSWVPVSKWETLPAGMVIDPAPNSEQTPFISQAPTLSVPLPALSYQGASIPASAYVCQVFLPNGSLMSSSSTTPKPPVLRVVAGEVKGETASYVGPQSGGAPLNYYNITILPYTGLIKVTRP